MFREFFAVGDVRYGSIKRVASGFGEGSIADSVRSPIPHVRCPKCRNSDVAKPESGIEASL